MEKIILVDGNNLLFRSYYATAYTGNLMKNSKGFPTNALYGFINMINKIVKEEKPVYMIVAFDKGKTFRHEKYDFYKDGRSETPDELKMQFPVAKEILGYMGIKYYEIDNYEADDIIGTFAEYCNKDTDYIGTIISSDKDLLQLISSDVDIKLLKQKDYIRYNEETFRADYGIDPIKIIDLKALMGDPSDNIPGVKGIGEKTALKLLQEHGSLDGIYENIESIKGKTKEKLLEGKNDAYMSYEIATIVKDVPLEINIDDIKYLGKDKIKLHEKYEELEFYSFLKKELAEDYAKEEIAPVEVDTTNPTFEVSLDDFLNLDKKESKYKIVESLDELSNIKECAIYLEILGTNYHNSEILGMGIYNNEVNYFVPFNLLKENPNFLTDSIKYTYDYKKTYVALKWQGINISNVTFDTMIAGSLLEYNVKDDIAYLANNFNYDIPFYENVYGKGTKLEAPDIEVIADTVTKKAKMIYETKNNLELNLKNNELYELFNEIEMPLCETLGDMEFSGIKVDKSVLEEMGVQITNRVEEIKKSIYEHAGCEFNISSPSQLGDILFEKLGLPHGKKGKTGYSTAVDVLHKIRHYHPIIDEILEYRTLTKLNSTYIDGIIKVIYDDNKLHTIYTQTLTRTGRLSSIEPNLQNIPTRYEEGKQIRKAFIPSENSIFLGGDYSQIELRILAHMANIESLIDAFKNGIDIHTKTAADIFHTEVENVTKEQRRMAKAVNFGIIYGISSFGLSEDLDIPINEAKKFIDGYYIAYPGIKEYMDRIINEAYQNGYVKTLFNRIRKIDELNNKNYIIRQQGERMALNTPIQGTSADIIKKAMVEINKKFKENNIQSKMILQIHDELIFDTLKEEEDKVREIVINTMEQIVSLNVPLKVELEQGSNWYELK